MSDIKHIAIIVDGNRRWAKEHNLPSLDGHKAGYKRVKELARWIFARGIPWASFYLFSRENWSRSKEEVAYLFDLLDQGLKKDVEDFVRDGIKMQFAGSRQELRQSTRDLMAEAEEKTASGTKGTMVACINYGGQQEIVEGVQKLAREGSDLTKLTLEQLKLSLSTGGLPPVDLMIRTSGEQRISNFLLWEIAYAELYFTHLLFPDFSKADLDEALNWFSSRERRFGT
ncbi:MAG: polyprenyl diphosphate synthase [Patescibacteria group bacterium]